MTDISVIKMIISVAVWRIYSSWVNGKLRAWEGLGHSKMFWARLSRDDFRSKLEIISFHSRVMSVSKSFLFPALLKDLAPNVQALGLLVSTMSWRSLWKLRSVTRHFFLANSDYRRTTSIFWKLPFFFSKQSRCYLPESYGDAKAKQKHFGDGTSKTRMNTWLPGVVEIKRRRTIGRRRDWYESCAVIHGPKEKKNTSQRGLCEVLTLSPMSRDGFHEMLAADWPTTSKEIIILRHHYRTKT